MKIIRLRSYAKVNLTLDVLGLLDNGYHELEMIMQQVNLYDSIVVKWIEDDIEGIRIHLKTNRSYLPVDERNLAYKAALIMAEKYGKGKNGILKIDIGKNIPVAAGLAGGSGNGGAVVLAINSLWNLHLPFDELLDTGKVLGADVPFTMMGIAKCSKGIPEYLRKDEKAATACLATYDGTVLKPVKPLDAYLVLSKPPISVSTKEVYQNIDNTEILDRPDTKLVLDALEQNNTEVAAKNMVNVLEFYSAIKYNCIMKTMESMDKEEGVLGTLMSGSGPTVFSVMDSKESAYKLMEKMSLLNKETYAVRTSI